MKENEMTDFDLTDGHKYRLVFLMVDVVASSELRSSIGLEPASNALVSFAEMVRQVVKKYAGELLFSSGDSFLIRFVATKYSAISDAIHCAQEIINAASRIHITEDLVPVFQVRIGVHTGEAVFSKETKSEYRQLVNMTSHLEREAYPNSILISDAVYRILSPDLRTFFRQNGFLGNVAIYTNEKAPVTRFVSRQPWRKGAVLEELVKEILSQMGYAVVSSISGPDRGFDLVAYGELPGLKQRYNILVECKAYSKKVNEKEVVMFSQKVQDFGAKFGVIVSAAGFTETAKKAAQKFGIMLFDEDRLAGIQLRQKPNRKIKEMDQ